MGLLSNLKQKIQNFQEDLEVSGQQFQAALQPKTVKLEDMIRKGFGFGGPTTMDPSGKRIDLIDQIGKIFKKSGLSDSTITISAFGQKDDLNQLKRPITYGSPVSLSRVAEQTLILFPNESDFNKLASSGTSVGFHEGGGISANLHSLLNVVPNADLSGQATDLIAMSPRLFDGDLPIGVMRWTCCVS